MLNPYFFVANCRLSKYKMVGTPPMNLSAKGEASLPGFNATIPIAFTSLEEAANCLDYQWNQCQRAIETSADSSELQMHRDRCLNIIASWQSALDAFVLHNALDRKKQQLLRTLHIAKTYYYINVASCESRDWCPETNLDAFLLQYAEIVSQARAFFDSEAECSKKGVLEPTFSLAISIIAPLYGVAHRCRDPHVRREAAALLRGCPRQEGLWDSIGAGAVVSKIIEIEEQGLGEVKSQHEIPEHARVKNVQVNFDMEGRIVTIKYSKMAHGMESESGFETLDW